MAEAQVLALINPLFRQIKVRSIDSFFFYHYGYLLLVIVLFVATSLIREVATMSSSV